MRPVALPSGNKLVDYDPLQDLNAPRLRRRDTDRAAPVNGDMADWEANTRTL